MFTRKDLEVALGHLTHLKQNGPTHPEYGICYNIAFPGNGCAIVKELSIGWDEHSGDADYPVPSVDSDRDHWGAYMSAQNGGLWTKDTEYGRSRWRLVDYLIERVSADLQQMPA